MKRCEEIWICYHLFPVFLVISPVFDASIRYVRRRRCFVYSISCTRPIADGCAFTSVLPAGHVGPQSPGKGLHAFRDSGTPNLNSTGRFSVTTFLAQKNSRIQPIWNWLLVKSGHVSRFWVFFVDILLPSSHIFPHLPTSSHIFPHLPTSSHRRIHSEVVGVLLVPCSRHSWSWCFGTRWKLRCSTWSSSWMQLGRPANGRGIAISYYQWNFRILKWRYLPYIRPI